MSDWERIGDWIATLTVASFAWVTSALAPEQPMNAFAPPVSPATAENQQALILNWAQQVDEPPIEQVGEDTGDDTEPLDEADPPGEAAVSSEDPELLDQGEPRATQNEDIELLDQGTAPAPAAESPAPAAVTVAPATTYVAPEPVVASGPVLPEGFGTGTVHVAAGRSGFPVGLEDCHVGAVTGRAYVGIDCGEGSSFVGHAPTFENFPFVLDENFPFGDDSVLGNRGGSLAEQDLEQNVEVLVSASRGDPIDDDATAPVIQTSGNSSVQFTQRARDRKARSEAESGASKRSKDSNKGAQNEVRAAAADDGDDRARAEDKDKKQQRGKDKDSNSRADSGDKERKSNTAKGSKKTNKQSDKKSKKSKKR